MKCDRTDWWKYTEELTYGINAASIAFVYTQRLLVGVAPNPCAVLSRGTNKIYIVKSIIWERTGIIEHILGENAAHGIIVLYFIRGNEEKRVL